MHHINRFSRLFGGVSLSLAIAASATPLLSWLPAANPSAQALSVQELRQNWERAWRNLFGQRPPVPPVPPTGGGSRPVEGGVCPIAPLAVSQVNPSILTTAIVWSDRPTFIWDGKVDKIGVRVRGSEDILWSQPVSGTNRVTYAGKALQPDRVYEWLVLSSNNQLKRFFPFRVVTTEERDRISQALQQLDQQLASEKITGEAATLRRAEFFATQQISNQPLWSQFWQEVLSVPTPSEQLTGWTRETITLMCNPSNTTVETPVQ
jgi:hypothetical protein